MLTLQAPRGHGTYIRASLARTSVSEVSALLKNRLIVSDDYGGSLLIKYLPALPHDTMIADLDILLGVCESVTTLVFAERRDDITQWISYEITLRGRPVTRSMIEVAFWDTRRSAGDFWYSRYLALTTLSSLSNWTDWTVRDWLHAAKARHPHLHWDGTPSYALMLPSPFEFRWPHVEAGKIGLPGETDVARISDIIKSVMVKRAKCDVLISVVEQGLHVILSPAPPEDDMIAVLELLVLNCVANDIIVNVGLRKRPPSSGDWVAVQLRIETGGVASIQHRLEHALVAKPRRDDGWVRSVICSTRLAEPGVLRTSGGRALLEDCQRRHPDLDWPLPMFVVTKAENTANVEDDFSTQLARNPRHVVVTPPVPKPYYGAIGDAGRATREDEDLARAISLSLADQTTGLGDWIRRTDAEPQPPAPLASPQLQMWTELHGGRPRDLLPDCCPVCGTSYKKLRYAGIWQAEPCGCLSFCTPCWRDTADRPTTVLDRSRCKRCAMKDVHHVLFLSGEREEDPTRDLDKLESPRANSSSGDDDDAYGRIVINWDDLEEDFT